MHSASSLSLEGKRGGSTVVRCSTSTLAFLKSMSTSCKVGSERSSAGGFEQNPELWKQHWIFSASSVGGRVESVSFPRHSQEVGWSVTELDPSKNFHSALLFSFCLFIMPFQFFAASERDCLKTLISFTNAWKPYFRLNES